MTLIEGANIPQDEIELEVMIQGKGLTAPRLTPEVIEGHMANVTYKTHVVPGTTTTVAVAFAGNGFSLCSVISACASPENFDEEVGRIAAIKRAQGEARNKLWELEGYHFKRNLENN